MPDSLKANLSKISTDRGIPTNVSEQERKAVLLILRRWNSLAQSRTTRFSPNPKLTFTVFLTDPEIATNWSPVIWLFRAFELFILFPLFISPFFSEI
jgi:hypothetical protein